MRDCKTLLELVREQIAEVREADRRAEERRKLFAHERRVLEIVARSMGLGGE